MNPIQNALGWEAQLFEGARDAIFISDAGSRFVQVNEAACELTGYTRDQLLAMRIPDLHDEIDLAAYRDFHARILAGEDALTEAAILRADGAKVPTEFNSRRIRVGDEWFMHTVARDLSERHAREAALRASEARFQAFTENAPTSVFMKAPDGRFLYLNKIARWLLGVAEGTGLGSTVHDHLPAPIAAQLEAWDREVLETGEPSLREARIPSPLGMRDWLTWRFTVPSPEGGPPNLGGIALDLTDLRALERERRRLALAMEQTGDLVIMTDPAGVIEYVNPTFEQVTGYAKAEAIGRTPALLQGGKTPDETYARLWRTITSGETWSGRLWNRRKDGSTYPQDTTISPVRRADGETMGFIGVGRDASEIEELAASLRQAQKMEAVGTLTGGLAHDFNNMLSVILANAQLLADHLPADPPEARSCLGDLLETASQGSQLTRQLLAFSRRDRMALEVVSLSDVASQAHRSFSRLLPDRIVTSFEAEPNVPHVYSNATALSQVLVNLLTNARDAMPDGGHIRVRVGMGELTEDDRSRFPWITPGPHVELEVLDEGTGMTPEVQERIFEPFFTTKDFGAGTGLGLSVIYGLVKQHNGAICVESRPDEGTSFQVLLPPASSKAKSVARGGSDAPARGASISASLPEASPAAGATILVAEDEPPLRRALTRVLERLGYSVLAAEDGVEALELFRARPGEVDLVISDLGMPGMGGEELRELLLEERPDLPFLFTSGYGEGAGDSPLPKGSFISKPWTIPDMEHAVRDALG